MMYRTCPYCGAHLDFGEVCDCKQKNDCDREARRGDDNKNEKENIDYERL